MAQAPTAEQTVFPEQGPLPQANGADFGGQIGAATEGLGQQVSQVGDEAFQQALKWQNLKNEATASDLDVQFQGDLGKLEAGYYQLKGKAAADAQPQFNSDLDALRKKYLGVAPNPMVQNMLGQSVAYSVGRSLRQAGQYSGDQTKAWMIQSADSRNQMLVAKGAAGYADPELQQQVGTALDAGVKNWAELNGLDPDSEAVKRAQFEADLQKQRIANAKAFVASHSIGDQATALLGVQPGTGTDVGGANYHRFVLATESPNGQNDPNNPDHQGPVQASQAWMQHFNPGGDRNNLQDSLKGLDNETAENTPKLEAALGRKVTDSDLYLAHQQGLQGAIALLKNPDAPASQSVPLANIQANIPANSGADAHTITGGQFAALYNAGEATGAITPANGTGVDKQLAAAVAVLPPDERQQMTKDVLAAWHTQDVAFREQTTFQQEQKIKADKQQYDDVSNQAKAVIATNWADPTKPPLDIAKLSQTPYAQQHPEIVTDLLNYRKNLDNKPDTGNAVTSQLYRGWLDGTKTTADFQEAFAPKDGSPGSISKDNLDFLMSAASGKKDPNAEAIKGLKADFIKNSESRYLKTPDDELDADSDNRFNMDFETKWEAMTAAGKDPRALITPGNNDYFGTLANLSLYSKTAADALAEQKAAADEAANPTLFGSPLAYLKKTFSGPSLPEGIPEGSVLAGKSKATGVDLYRLPKALGGGLVSAGAPPEAAGSPPEASTGQ